MRNFRTGLNGRWLTTGVLTLALAACGGGGGGTAVSPGGGITSGTTPGATPTPAANGATGTLSFTVTVPAATTSSTARSTKFVSPSTQSIAISIKGQPATLATVNLSATAPGCSLTAGATTCTVTTTAPVGADTFVVTAFDGANGTGHQLSTANVPATITTNSTTRVPLTLNGTVATVAAVLGSSSVQVGTPAQVAVTVVAYDAQQNVIVGPGSFSTPVTLADTDASGATSLSTITVTAPGTSVTLNYSGNSMTTASITPSIGSTPGTAATFQPTGSAFVNYLAPQPVDEIDAFAPGPNGNLWFTSFGSSQTPTVGYITTQGTATVYTAGLNDEYVMGLARGSDGNMWIGGDSGAIGMVNPVSGNVTYASDFTNTPCQNATTACGSINAMTLGPDGNVWFTDVEGYVGYVTPGGTVFEFSVTALTGQSSEPKGLAFSGSNLYVGDEEGFIDQITLSGSTPQSGTAVPFLQPCECGSGGYGLAIDTQGNVWFSDGCSDLGMIPTSSFSQGSELEWNVSAVIGSHSFGFLQAVPGGGVVATDDIDGSIYGFSATGVSSSQGPLISSLTAFSNTQADANALALGSDGNLWTATNSTTNQNPNVPPAIAKVYYSAGSIGTTLQPTALARRASTAFTHIHTAKKFPQFRPSRKARHAAYVARMKALGKAAK